MKTKNYILHCCLLCLFGVILTMRVTGQDKYIMFISSNESDVGFIEMLEEEGYNVALKRGTYGGILADSEDKLDSLNNADLIIFSRNNATATYGGDEDLATQWNSITAPLVNFSGWIARDNRWKWISDVDVNPACGVDFFVTVPSGAEGNALYNGVTITDGQVEMTTEYPSGTIPAEGTAGSAETNGSVLAVNSETPSDAFIIYWEAGVPFYSGATQTPEGDRWFFSAGMDNNCDGSPSTASGEYNLTEDGKKMLINVVEKYLNPPSDIRNNITNPFGFTLSPVPATDHLVVDFTAGKAEWTAIEVYDFSGKLFYSKTIQVQNGKNEITLDINHLSAGAYLVKVKIDGLQQTRKFTVR